MKAIINKQKILTYILIIIGAAAVIFFGMRATRSILRMRDYGFGKPPTANQIDISLIRNWMTVPYIAQMYHIPPEPLFKSLKIPQNKENGKKSLMALNNEFYPDQDGSVLAHVQAAIQALQKQERPPRFPATPISVTPTTLMPTSAP